jgi:hypothetical protein
LLALGTSWHRDSTTQDYSLATTSTDGTPGAGAADHFDGSSRTWAAYATFQQTLGAVTLEPGLRAERNVRHVAGASAGEVPTAARLARTALFPRCICKSWPANAGRWRPAIASGSSGRRSITCCPMPWWKTR